MEILEVEFHPAGVVVCFDDEEILSSNEHHWNQLVTQAHGGESWPKKHRRRVPEGLAAKRATKHDPGGQPPIGYRRDPATKLVVTDEAMLPVVRHAFDAASGAAHRRVEAAGSDPRRD